MWQLVKRTAGSVITFVMLFLAFGDAPDQWATWKSAWHYVWSLPGIDWAVFWGGNGGRSVLLLFGLGVGLWTWDVPQRAIARMKADPNALLTEAKKKRNRVELRTTLHRLFDRTARHAISGAMKQHVYAAGWLRRQGRESVDWLAAELMTESQAELEPRIQALLKAQNPVDETQLVTLLTAWGDVFKSYQRMVRSSDLVHRRYKGENSPWANLDYRDWREHDKKLIDDLKLIEHADGAQHLAVKLRDAGWGDEYRPLKPTND